MSEKLTVGKIEQLSDKKPTLQQMLDELRGDWVPVQPSPVEGAETRLQEIRERIRTAKGFSSQPGWVDGDVVYMAERVSSLQQQLAEARKENEALKDWRADVTVALQRPGGAFYEDVPKHIREAVAALARLQAWQPIETAPKDGTAVIGFRARSQNGAEGSYTHVTVHGRSGWTTVPGRYSFAPTHWMPLPPSPTDAPAEKER